MKQIDWRSKGLPGVALPVDRFGVPVPGWNLFDGRALLPTMVLRRDALADNIAIMGRFAAESGLSLAPHGKTTMAPRIWQQQLEAGAWAITVATAWQARVATEVGVPRIVIANEVADEGSLEWIGSVLDDEGPELIGQADSVAVVERMSQHVGQRRRRLPVLVEIGMPGGRTGARSFDAARAVINALVEAPGLQLAGVTCFEGIAPGDTAADREAVVSALLGLVRDVARSAAGSMSAGDAHEIVLSGGGSIHFLAVAAALREPLTAQLPARVVIRSGATVTHDDGYYEEASPFGASAAAGEPRLKPALEVWAPVLSTPEPGLAIAGAGKRDLPYDVGLPTVIKQCRSRGPVESISAVDVSRLDDQHAYVSLEPPADVQVGDLLGFGISHPCSAFDRWRAIPVVDDAYDIVDVYETLF